MNDTTQLQSKQQILDFNRLLAPLRAYWYLILLSAVLFVLAGLAYLHYTTPLYQVQATILVSDGDENGLTADALQKDLLGISSEPKVYEDVRILKSRSLIQQVVDSLNLENRILHIGRVRDIDLYRDGPVDMDSILLPFPESRGESRYLFSVIDTATYHIHVDNDVSFEGRFGRTLTNEHGSFLLHLQPGYPINAEYKYDLVAQSNLDRARHFLESFSVQYDPQQPTILDLYIKDEIPQRGIDVLTEIIETYNRLTINDKNKTSENTLSFINERIDILAGELDRAERSVEFYKTRENLTIDVSTDLQYIQSKVGEYENQLVNLEIQNTIMEYIADFLKENPSQFIPLANSSLSDNGVSDLINQYNQIVQEKNRLQQTVTDNHSSIRTAEQQLQNLELSIREAVETNLDALEIRRHELDARNAKYVAELNATPRRERELIDKKRQQQIKENLFLYLLEKREEAAISVAATVENAKVIDPPLVTGVVSPKKGIVLLGAGLGGLILPLGAILLFALFDDRLKYTEDIENLTAVPLLGTIVQSKKKEKVVIKKASRSAIAEMFRLLRTNLEFLLGGAEDPVIMITSTTGQEGKTFMCVNLGMSYALSGKKVLLVGFDLRKPKMAQYLVEDPPALGISNYLIGRSLPEEIIHPYPGNENLFFIGSGSIPPNPSELILNGKFETLLDELKEQFDMVIIDSPPVGLVTDSLLLNKYVKASLYVTRFGTTKKNSLKLVDQLYKANKLTNPAIVFNGARNEWGTGYGYGYGYYREDK